VLSETAALFATWDDFQKAKRSIRPSALREIMLQIPDTPLSSLAFPAQTLNRLLECIQYPILYPETFRRLQISPPKGILLYGPPGGGKTMAARALACESGVNFLAVKGGEIFQKYVGESERALREIFRKARAASPAIIFLDEVDAIAYRRQGMSGSGSSGGGGSSVSERVLTTLLMELDGLEPLLNVIIVAATNRPDVLDPALLRPGRVDRLIFIPPPDKQSRIHILKQKTAKMPLASDVDLSSIADQTDGLSGAEMVAVCQEAALAAMQEDPANVSSIAFRHFESAIASVGPRISSDMIRYYEQFEKTFGARGG
jgi:AAA family ATPase